MIDLIKVTSVKAVEATNPVNVLFGVVDSLSPIKISIHQKLTLTSEFLSLTDTAKNKLVNGDRVVLLRVQGGQQFVVLDKVVS